MRRWSVPVLLLLALTVAWWARRPAGDGDARRSPAAAPAPAPGPGPVRSPSAAPPAARAALPWALTGRVLGADGGPVPGAVVRAVLRRGAVKTELPAAPVDASGAYRLDLAALSALPRLARAAGYLQVHAEAPRCGEGGEEEFALSEQEPGAAWVLDHVLEVRGRVRGRVVDGAGQPVPGAEVRVWLADTAGASAVVTDDAGRYHCDVREAGSYVVAASVGDLDVAVGTFEVALGADLALPDAVLDVPGGFVQGVVVQGGLPVAGVRVAGAPGDPPSWGRGNLDLPSTTSDAQGRFRLYLLEQRDHHLGADTLSFRGAASPACHPGDRDVRIDLPPCRLLVRVTAPDGTPLPGAELDYTGWRAEDAEGFEAVRAGTLAAADPRARAWDGSVGNDQQGEDGTEIQYVDPETCWFVVARIPGGVPAEGSARFERGQVEARLDLVVRESAPTGRLALRLLDDDGQGIPEYALAVETLAGTLLANVRPGPGGSLPPVPSGRVRIVVQPAAGARWTIGRPCPDTFLLPIARVIDVPAGGTLPLDLQPRRGGRLRLRLEGGTGGVRTLGYGGVSARPRGDDAAPPIPLDRWILGQGTGRQVTNLWTSGTQPVCARSLVPGEYILTVRTDAHHAYEAYVQIRPGEVTQAVIRLDDDD